MPMKHLCGIVKKVNFSKNKSEDSSFVMETTNDNTEYLVYYRAFCPIRVDDTIVGVFDNYKNSSDLILLNTPFVQPPISKDFVIQCFMKVLRIGYNQCFKYYNEILKANDNDEKKVILTLNSLAQEWMENRDIDKLYVYPDIPENNMRRLLTWWHKERNLRRLYLFTLNKKEINASRLTCDEIYERCMSNPYTVPSIPLEKCETILYCTGKTIDNDAHIRGSIVRIIWNNLHNKGWNATPIRYLAKQFPMFYEHKDALENEYDVVYEYSCAYLKYPHKVEKWIASYIAELRSKDLITYNTPLDERITLEDGTIIERHSAHFERELSEDQQKAVQGALDHTISIISGGAGTGKCLAKRTPIVMYDGSIKYVENIKNGDIIMGPDSKPKIVISTCSGKDDMYKIIPVIGKPFICNKPHMLTLNINNTLVDMPLNEYLELSDEQQIKYKLQHIGVEYPFQTLKYEIDIMVEIVGNYLKYQKLVHNDIANELNMLEPYMSIPNIYKVNTRFNRLQLAEKLLEYMNILKITRYNKEYKIYECKPPTVRLLEDLEYLYLSLGIMTERRDKHLYIYYQYNDMLSQKFEVKYVGYGKYYGFELTGDGRFLLGDFLITHNTTCLGQIVHNLELRSVSYALCAFTGKAVARIREVIKKRNPSTIHRLIANAKNNKLLLQRPNQFEKDIPLSEYEHVIIDEVSMLTSELLYQFLRVYPNIKKLTLIGDINQLQPIEWGSFFHQLLTSETIPTYYLTTNFRVYTTTGEADGIILNSNAIITHKSICPFSFVITDNFMITDGTKERVFDIIKCCFSAGIKSEQLVVLSPYNRYLDIINRKFQEIYDVGSKSIIDSRGVRWMIGDRVMLTDNDNEIGVFNGESGTIHDVQDKFITVHFPNSGNHDFLLEPTNEQRFNTGYGKSVRYKNINDDSMDMIFDGDEYDECKERTVKKLMHSYCITIDKSQGSEWDFGIVYIPEFNTGTFLNKNRIYTAITRFKRCCWCVVDDVDLLSNCATKLPAYRCENLSKRFKELLPHVAPYKIPSNNINLQMDCEYPELYDAMDNYYEDSYIDF